MFNIAILGSTRGSNLPGIFLGLKDTPCQIKTVISNKENAGILEKARDLNLATRFINSDIKDFEILLHEHLTQEKIDLIVLVGFMKILSPWFVERWQNKVINVHPSLLPKHAGLMNLSVHQAVLANKEKETGCTVHWITDILDGGKIILQKKCPVLPSDSAESVKARVQSLEVLSLIESIIQIQTAAIHKETIT